jgi:hypothetical protein
MGGQDRDQFWHVLSDEAREGLYRWRSGQPHEIVPIEWLGGGKSGSPIAVIARPGRGYDDQVLIKFAHASEVNNWQLAWSDCEDEYRERHLVEMFTNSPITSGSNPWWIAMLRIAAGDTSVFRPMAELVVKKGDDFASICKAIVSSTIADWNPRPRPHSPAEVPRASLMNEVFDISRRAPSKYLREWFDSNFKNFNDPLIRRQGWPEWQPNPFTFAGEADLIADRDQLGVQYGRAHGDLHLHNILIPVNPPEAAQYKLIDLGGYSSKAPLARDPMHFLLAISLDWMLNGISPGSSLSRALIDITVKPRGRNTEKEYQVVSQAIHEAGREWAAATGWGKEWTEQSLLLLAGCALRYASKEFSEINDPDAARDWFFEVSVAAARAYLEETSLWETYREAHTPRSLSHPQPGTPRAVPDISDRLRPESAGDREGDENPGARVLKFPGPSQLDLARTLDKIMEGSADQASWEDLAEILQEVKFDGHDWEELARNTGPLLEEISYSRPAHPLHQAEIQDHLNHLQTTLNDVLRPGVSAAKLRSACIYADNLRGHLLVLLPRSEE